MASKKKTLRRKAARHAKKYPEYEMQDVKDTLHSLTIHATLRIKESPRYKKYSRDDKYWHKRNVERLGNEVEDAMDAILDEVVRLQDIARIATDEAIQSNIEANMYKNMLGDKGKEMSSVAKVIKNSLFKRVRDEEKLIKESKTH